MTSVAAIDQRNARVGMLAILGALAMLGLGYASVPLYQLFCQATGFGGTTQRASESDADAAARIAQSAGGRTISIRFDANTASDLPWPFRPAQPTDTVQIGIRDMPTYVARTDSRVPYTSPATCTSGHDHAGRSRSAARSNREE